MARFIIRSLLGCSLLIWLGNFKCVEEDCELPFLLRDWSSSWLDNSGRQPFSTDGAVPRRAFGIRLSARLSSDGSDTIRVLDLEPCYLLALQPIRRIQILAAEAFDTLAAGQDISARFRIRLSGNAFLQYLPLENVTSAYNTPFDESLAPSFHIDLLMTDPPQKPGDYRFSVSIRYDTLSPPLNTDTTFVLPKVTLL